jgi:hypothetical protein
MDNMDKLLQATSDLTQSSDLKKMLKAIEQTSRMPEPLALGFFALIRRQAKNDPALDSEAIETAIASTNRVGLNVSQVADQLAAQINQRSMLTQTGYRIMGELLGAVRAIGPLPTLVKNGHIQIDAFAELVRRAEENEARKALEQGLYDWRGRPRTDTTALAAELPFLKPDIDRFARRSVFAYPTRICSNMKEAFIQGRASAGFFVAAAGLILVLLLVILITRSTNAANPPVEAPKVDAKIEAPRTPPTVREELTKAFSDPKVSAQFQGSTIVVLDDVDAATVIEVLTRTINATIVPARGTFGAAPEGCDWLKHEDLNLLDPKLENGARVIIACFVRTPQGRQFRFVHLPSRTVALAVSVPATTEPASVTTDQCLIIAEEEFRSGSMQRADLAFRQAYAAKKSRTDEGRYHRRYAAFLHAGKAPEAQIAEHLRRAARYLPRAEYESMPSILRDAYRLHSTFNDLENRLTRPDITPTTEVIR